MTDTENVFDGFALLGVNFGPTATYTRTFSHGITDF